jgi:hypothetical protein
VSQLPKELTTAERARWLAELSEALHEAQQLASRLGVLQIHGADAVELCLGLAGARAQVQALQFARPEESMGGVSPKSSNPPLWPDQRTGDR